MRGTISILHIGLPLEPPWLTPQEGREIAARLAGIQQKMEAAGYSYAVEHASPHEGLTLFRERLRMQKWDAVLIGGGVVGNPELSAFKQEIVDAVCHEAPRAKVLEFDHAVDPQTLVERALGRKE